MRLLTRSDFDGLACGAILLDLGIISQWKFVHPKDMQDGLVEVTSQDVLANVPYVKGAALWFDHHDSETERLGSFEFEGESRPADSAARIIYEYYGGKEKMPHFEEMIQGVDKVDSGKLDMEDVLHPSGWVLLGFVMDPRSGFGRFRNFRISNYELMEFLMEACRHMPIEEILELPDVKERVKLYHEQDLLFTKMIETHTKTDGNVIITDLRNADTIYTGNRFTVYCLYPKQNISLWVVDGRGKINCAIAVGHSIFNRTSGTNVGSLLLQYGGGGHPRVGTCQVAYEKSDETIEALVTSMKKDG